MNRSKERNSDQQLLKKLVWAYLILLIFEGALRKWVLPELATPLLLIRDPVAVWLLISTWRQGKFTPNIYFIIVFLIGVISVITAVLLGHGNLWVALYGARILLIHFPVIFIVGIVLDRSDLLRIGRFLTWLSIPMVVLLMIQFYSPQSAWVNRGVGGDVAGAGFSGALGYFRAPTTFSFTNGTSLYFSLAACFIFYFWLVPHEKMNRLILAFASLALLLSVPFSISRTLFFSVLVTLAFIFIAVIRKPGYTGRVLITAFIIMVIIALASQLSMFQTATEVFTARFNNADEQEGGLKGTLGDRYFGGLISAFTSTNQLPFFGYGIGMGTNAGSAILTGKREFLIAEGEWARLVGELGITLGLAVIVIRVMISARIALDSYRRLLINDFLPWVLLSFCLLTLPQGTWNQPTALGFCVFAAGMTIASLKGTEENSKRSIAAQGTRR